MNPSHGLSPEICPYLTVEKQANIRICKMDFSSLSQLHLFLISDPPINSDVFYSKNSLNSSEEFAGAPLDVAIDYCIGGYEKDFSLFVKMKKDIDRVNVRVFHPRKVFPSVVGSRPNVPAFVAGAPKSMYRMERVQQKKFITIYMNLAYTSGTTEAQIRNRGILTLNLIKILEHNNYGVNFKVFEACHVENEIFAASIGLKKTGELLNVKKCYYPLCGREFLRRVLSRVKESMPFKERWNMSYGLLLSDTQTRNIMSIPEDAIIIGPPSEMGIAGNDIYEDADAFWEKLHLSEEIIVPHYMKESKENRI